LTTATWRPPSTSAADSRAKVIFADELHRGRSLDGRIAAENVDGRRGAALQRHAEGWRDGGHSRQSAHPLEHATNEQGVFLGRLLPRWRKRELADDDVARIQPRLDLLDCEKGAHHQSRADEKDNRERDLHRDQQRAQPAVASSTADALARTGQAAAEIAARGPECGRQAAENRRQHGHPDRGRQRLGAEADFHFRRQRVHRNGRSHPPDAGEGEQGADAGARRGERKALGEELLHQPAARSAETGAQRELRFARGRPRQEQVGDVAARDHQQHQHGAREDVHHLLQRSGRIDVSKAAHRRGQAVGIALVRKGARDVARGDGHVRRRLLDRHIVFQPRVGPDEERLAVRAAEERVGEIGRELRREEDVGAVQQEPRRQDRHEGPHDAIEFERHAEHLRVAVELLVPEPIAHHESGRRARLAVGVGNRTAQDGPDAKRRQRLGVEVRSACAVGGVPEVVQHLETRPAEHVAEHAGGLLAELGEDRRRIPVRRPALLGRLHVEVNHPSRVLERKGINQDAVDDAENDCSCPDAKRQREDGRAHRAAVAQQASHGVPEIAAHPAQPIHGQLLSERLARASNVSRT
jgi:hypothetical protein